jgi:hypothetical protein
MVNGMLNEEFRMIASDVLNSGSWLPNSVTHSLLSNP